MLGFGQRWKTPRLAAGLLGTLVLVGAMGATHASALLGILPIPAPTITSGPASTTLSNSATFVFTDNDTGLKLGNLKQQCSLDGSSFTNCSSPKTYIGLAAGSHLFRVKSTGVLGDLPSTTTSYSWLIDYGAPLIVVAFPGDGGSYNASGWNAGCAAGPGVCGTASDPSGVVNVAVSVRQAASGKWWGGAAFDKTTEFFIVANGAGSWRLPLPMPSGDGSYTVHARATDGLGNTMPAGSYAASTFTVDTQPPPTPVITDKPASLTTSTNASLSFSEGETAASFVCSLDSATYAACASPKSYANLGDGSHTFKVKTRDAAGNLSDAASWTWTVDTTAPSAPKITQNPGLATSAYTDTFAFTDTQSDVSYECKLDRGAWTACATPKNYYGLSQGTHTFAVRAVDTAGNRSGAALFVFVVSVSSPGTPFTMSGDATGVLFPGANPVPIALKLTNPGASAITVNAVTVGVAPASLPAGCTSAWFQIVQSDVADGNAVAVPAHSSVTLPAQGVAAPAIRLIESNTNQNACKNAHPTLTYNGSAHS